jgi:murein DD-endopeptidase MepM/ murein hydrolase activator NlpD
VVLQRRAGGAATPQTQFPIRLRLPDRRGRAHIFIVAIALVSALYAAFAGSATPSAGEPNERLETAQGTLVVIQTETVRQSLQPLQPSQQPATARSQQPAPPIAAAATPEPPSIASSVDPDTGPFNAEIEDEEDLRTQALYAGLYNPPPYCEPSESPAYCIYTVHNGDTLSGIAERFSLKGTELPGWELIAASNKPDITDMDDFIQPGQKLRIPNRPGIVHTILFGETVGDLADVFDVTSASIASSNGLANRDLLTIGQVLLIPDPKRVAAPPPPDPGPTLSSSAAAPEPAARPEPAQSASAAGPVSSSGFIWPITAAVRITNYMSARHPLGIDMGLGHAPGTPVRAVADGRVEFAGGNACCSYGLYVIVDHGNGLKTLYAHLSRLSVARGQYVDQGDTLGPSGTTGYSTGVHLHFEVHRNGTRVNPMNYLP